MCSCDIKVPQSKTEELIFDRNKTKDMDERIVISKKGFLNGDIYEFLKFTWAIDKEALIKAFSEKDLMMI